MQYSLRQIVFAALALPLFVCGCSGPSKPDGLPDRVPLEITLTQDGKPLQEATVQLVSPDVPWSITGNTDAHGTAKMVTHGQFAGVPPGPYKVVVIKRDVESTPTGDRKTQTLKIYSLVDPKLSDRQTTTLELMVEKGKKTTTLELGASDRVLLDTEIVPMSEF